MLFQLLQLLLLCGVCQGSVRDEYAENKMWQDEMSCMMRAQLFEEGYTEGEAKNLSTLALHMKYPRLMRQAIKHGLSKPRRLITLSIGDKPVCHSVASGGPRARIWIAMAAWDDPTALKSSLRSVKNQAMVTKSDEEKRADVPERLEVHTVVFEDYSENFLPESDKSEFLSSMDITFLRKENSPSMGGAYGKWQLFQEILGRASPEDYVFVLDGDDNLADKQVMWDLYSKVLSVKKPWVAWGKHIGKFSEQCGDIASGEEEYSFREHPWVYCHPRIFKAHLLQQFKIDHFQRDNGEWLQKSTDRPYMFEALEMAGPKRVHYITEREPMVIYNTGTSHEGLMKFSGEVVEGDKNLVNHRRSMKQHDETIHIVCVINERENSRTFLEHLVASDIDRKIHIHVGLNNPNRQRELQRLAKELSKPARLIDIQNIGWNIGGFGRFLVAKKVTTVFDPNFILMLDDDELVGPKTIQEVWDQRAPKTFASWYGKNWESKDSDYWFPKPPTFEGVTIGDQPDVSKWTYAGAGMSVVDAAIFSDERVFEIPQSYLFVEDMWMSYIAKVNKWDLKRIFTKFEMDHGLNGKGQFNGLCNVKRSMLKELNSCSTSFMS